VSRRLSSRGSLILQAVLFVVLWLLLLVDYAAAVGTAPVPPPAVGSGYDEF
jgi:hypothetical protein